MVWPGRDKLSGLVEINEALIGGEHSGKRGRGAEGKTLVLIAAEDTGVGVGRIIRASLFCWKLKRNPPETFSQVLWGDETFEISPLGLAHAKICQEISSRMEDYILLNCEKK